MRNLFRRNPDQNEGQWLSISDMMTVLMAVFLFVSISFMIDAAQKKAEADKQREKVERQRDSVQEAAETYRNLQKELLQDLRQEFEQTSDLKKWNAEIDPDTLSIRFQDPVMLFRQGSSRLPAGFRAILDDFFPRYVRILAQDKYRTEIEEIRIEGHTSSEWQESVSPNEAYFNNMELSQDRTRSTLKYVLQIPRRVVKDNLEWIQERMTANGLSFSKRLDRDGKLIKESGKSEDKRRSRRVEFRIRISAEKRIELIEELYEDFKEARESFDAE